MNKRVFLKNTAVMTATSLALRALGIVFRIFISNRVGAEGMGLYQQVFSVYVLSTTFAGVGLTTAVTRLVGEALARNNQQKARKALRLSVALCLGIGLFTAAAFGRFAAPIARLLGDERATAALRVSGLALPMVGVSGCLKGYFLARRKATPPSLAQIVEQLVRIGAVLLLLQTPGAASLGGACCMIFLGDGISEGASCLCLLVFFAIDRRRLRGLAEKSPAPAVSAQQTGVLAGLLSIALPLTAGRYLTSGLRTAENLLVPAMLAPFVGSETRALEQFGAVKAMALPLVFFPAALLVTVSGLLVPELSDAFALGQRKQVARLTERALCITLAGAFLFGGLFTALGRPLGRLLYGDETVGLILKILGPLTPVMYLDTVATGLLRGLGQQVHSLWYSVADSALRLALIPLLLPRFGLVGFLFLMTLSNWLTAWLSTQRLLKVSGVKMRWRSWIFLPGSAAALGIALWELLGSRLGLFSALAEALTGGAVVGGVFLGAFFLMGGGRTLRNGRSLSPLPSRKQKSV